MTLTTPNPTPRFAAALSGILQDEAEQCIILDVGSRNGLDPVWAPLQAAARFIGFEPDPQQADRLNRSKKPASRIRHYPFALSDRDGERTFNITRFPESSSFYAENPAWTRRFPITEQTTERQVTLPTITIDTFCGQEDVRHLDFLKIDAEGAELDILRGAVATMSRTEILGIKTEYWWSPRTKSGYAHSFAELDIFLRQNGFEFFDIRPHYYPRATVPSGRITARFDNPEAKARLKFRHVPYGQSWTGDALYFRDPVGEKISGKDVSAWDRSKLIRLCAVMDIYDYGDSALEILEYFYPLFGDEIHTYYDLLTPTIDGNIYRYDEFLKISQETRQRYRQTHLGLTDWCPGPTRYRRD